MARNTKTQERQKAARKAERVRRAKRQRAIRIGVIGGVVGIVLVAILVLSWPQPDVGSVEAEAWDLPQLDGPGRVTLADFSGKPTVAVFFASWCTVCEGEVPQFLDVSQRRGDDVNFVGINSQDNGRGMGDARKWGIADNWTLARDIGGGNGSGLSVGTFGARGMPMTVLYTADGEIAHIQRGGISGADLDRLLTDLFGV